MPGFATSINNSVRPCALIMRWRLISSHPCLGLIVCPACYRSSPRRLGSPLSGDLRGARVESVLFDGVFGHLFGQMVFGTYYGGVQGCSTLEGGQMSDQHRKVKQSVYLPEDMLTQLRAEAERLERP